MKCPSCGSNHIDYYGAKLKRTEPNIRCNTCKGWFFYADPDDAEKPEHLFYKTNFTTEEAIDVLNNIRKWLRDGCTITAANIDKVLEKNEDGTFYSGLSIQYPKKRVIRE